MSKPRVGYIGVGLMGHGAAKNILEKGHPLTIMGHRNRAPVEDLVKRGAKEGKSAAEIARGERHPVPLPPLLGRSRGDGLRCGRRTGRRACRADRGRLHDRRSEFDAPHRRRPESTKARACSTRRSAAHPRRPRKASSRPMWAATTRPSRRRSRCSRPTRTRSSMSAPLGMGHTLKLINNFISIGTAAIISEAAATAAKVGVDMRKFYEVISAGGANSKMFQMMMPWVLEGDDSHLKGPLRIAGKDLRFYTQARRTGAGRRLHRAGREPDAASVQHARPRRPLPAGAAGAHGRVERREDPRSLTLCAAFASVAAMGENANLPLAGVTVVEFCHSVAGPLRGLDPRRSRRRRDQGGKPRQGRLRARLGTAVRARHLDAVPCAQSQQARARARSARPRHLRAADRVHPRSRRRGAAEHAARRDRQARSRRRGAAREEAVADLLRSRRLRAHRPVARIAPATIR